VGAIGVIAYVLFKNTLEEKKQDRELYRKSVNTFTETSKQYADSIQNLSLRMENVEEGNERIENKLDKVLNK
jgi:gas vesicle protein